MYKNAILHKDEVKKRMKDHLKSGWIIVSGSLEGIRNLEYSVYLPGTKENENFALIITPRKSIFLAKKTEKLRKTLKSLSTDEFNMLIMLECYKIEDLAPTQCIFVKKESNRNHKINELIEGITEVAFF